MKLLIAIVAILVFLILPSINAIIVHGETSADCGFLLALLNMELNYAINYNTTPGIMLAQDLLNMSLPSEVASVHRQVYQAFRDYFNVLRALETGEYTNTSALSMLRALIRSREVFTSNLNTYVNYLSSCTLDQNTMSRLRDSALSLINKLLNTIYPNLIQSILYALRGPEVVKIDLPKDVFKPGETIYINITPLVEEIHILKVEVAHWPTLRSLTRLSNYTYMNNSYLITYTAPYLSEVKSLLVGNTVQLAVVVTYVFHNVTLSYAKFFEITYDYPNVTINAPSRVNYGDDLQLIIASDKVYNFTVLVNNARVLNATLVPGTNTYSVRFNTTLFRTGYNNLKVIIHETPITLEYTVEKSFLVEAVAPTVDIQSPAVIVDWGNSFLLTIVKYNESKVNLIVFVNDRVVLNKTLEDHVYSFNVVLNTLFFTQLRVEAYVVNEHGVQVLASKKEALYINSLSTTALTLVAVLLANAVRKEPIILLNRSFSEKKPLINQRTRSPKTLLELRITYSVKSKIASIYYNLLSKLGLPQPSLSETLREHFEKLKLKSNLAKVLWKLLMLAERDLYSSRKPSYDEAVELAKEAEENAGK